VVITWLDVVFVKTCVYTCTSSELHLIIICLYFITHLYALHVHVKSSFDDSFIYTCFPYFFTCLASCIYYFCLKLIDIHVYPWVTCLHAKFYFWLIFFGIFMHTFRFDKTYIYLDTCLIVIKFFSFDVCFELYWFISWICYSHDSCTLILFLFTHDFVLRAHFWAL